MVQFCEALPVTDDGVSPKPPRMAIYPDGRTVKGEAHGSSGPEFVIFTCADYCQVNELTKLV